MRAALGALIACLLAGTASADPVRPAKRVVRVHVGPAFYTTIGDAPGLGERPQSRAPGVQIALFGSQALSEVVALHGYGFGLLALRETLDPGVGVGFGPTLMHRRSGLFAAPSLWAGWLGGEPDGVERRFDAWFGGDLRLGLVRRLNSGSSVGVGLDAWFGRRPASGEGYRSANGFAVELIVAR